MDKFKEDEGGEMVQERPAEYEEQSTQETAESNVEPQAEAPSSDSDIGISSLMNKRAKLEEAIDYVGGLIANLKEKRTNLEKEIEEESVDIKNLKEKLMKVSDYINEETQGIEHLTQKRNAVEHEADEVGSLISTMRDKLSGIDKIIEGKRISTFKESRKTSSF
jgi:chromosome segregation ATPase